MLKDLRLGSCFNLTVLKDLALGSLGIPFPFSNCVERRTSWQLFNPTVLKDLVLGGLHIFSSNPWQLFVILESMNTLNTHMLRISNLLETFMPRVVFYH